jgi:hypothetical protein
MLEKKKATNRELHLSFIDLTKAYGSLALNKLWETLDKSTINTKLIEDVKDKKLHCPPSSKVFTSTSSYLFSY